MVRERYRREAMVSIFRILGESLSLTKFLLATDRPVELKDFAATLLERADFRTDLFVLSNLSMDSLDYAGPRISEGKGVLLGLGEPRLLPETFVNPSPPAGRRVFTDGALCVECSPHADAPDAAALVADPAFQDWPLVVLVDDAQAASRSAMGFLWTTFTRFDPARDLHARAVELVHPSFRRRSSSTHG